MIGRYSFSIICYSDFSLQIIFKNMEYYFTSLAMDKNILQQIVEDAAISVCIYTHKIFCFRYIKHIVKITIF